MPLCKPLLGVAPVRSYRPVLALVAASAALAACGGGGGGDAPTAGTYQIGGTVSALAPGKKLVLQNNGGDDLTIENNGPFGFASRLASGAAYAVTVKTQPDGQACNVGNGSGTASADVRDVAVTCVAVSTPLPPGNGPTQGAAGVAGNWLQSLCVEVNGKGHRQLLRVAHTGSSTVSLERDFMVYAATNCSGTGALLGLPTTAGSVQIQRSAATPTLAANWGLWTYPSGQAYNILAKKGETVLCLIGDANPSALPTAAAVEGYADLSIAKGACYVKQ